MMDIGYKATGRAWGKVILLGEHAVVHGCRAVAMALPRGVTVTATPNDGPMSLSVPAWNMTVTPGDGSAASAALTALITELGLAPAGIRFRAEVDLPPRAGLGSSAALAAAMARAAVGLKQLQKSKDDLFSAVQASERIFHGNPSGLDATMALDGGIGVFSRQRGATFLKVGTPPVIVAHSGEPGETRAMVTRFSQKLARYADEGRARLAQISDLVDSGIDALHTGDLSSLGQVMCTCHEILRWFGMSTPGLDRIVSVAMDAGALGAKLTGGGGGGCAIILLRPGDRAVVAALNKAGIAQVGL
ncbi:MAG: mevalonate kinase [Myxococcota bacterium]|nr:mevalonate kinase [Myxococcota bacterium]